MRAINKHNTNPKIWGFEMPNAPYLNRWPKCKRLTKSFDSPKHHIEIEHNLPQGA